jgi:hypothetical protein
MTALRLRLAGAVFVIVGLMNCDLCLPVAAQQVNYVVPEPTFLIKQPKPNACWATAAAMLQSWKAKALLSIDKVVESADPTYLLVYKSDSGLSARDKAGFLNALHLHSEPPATYSAQALEAKLRLWGPLWVTTAEPAGKNFSIHARVVMGITGDGSGSGTILIIADPDDGAKHTESLDAFTQKLSTLARSDYGSGADVRPMIVHF